MKSEKFDVAALTERIESLYNEGLPRKAREVLMEPWPGMEEDMACLYKHLFLAAREGTTHLFLEACELGDDGLSVRFPEWMGNFTRELVSKYGELEGSLRYHKAIAVYSARLCVPNGRQELQSAMEKAAVRLATH